MTRIADLHAEWLKDPSYRTAYEALEGEFSRLAVILSSAEAKDGVRFEIYRDASGRFRWRLARSAGDVLAQSPGDFGSSEEARQAIDALRTRLVDARIVDTAA